MVKSGGTKRKIKMEKIPRRDYLATAFTKRSSGLYSKVSQLCLLTGAQIAILATPASSQSSVSFYSFGHSSVDAIVSAFLRGQRPPLVPEETREEDIGICMARKELGLELWWENEDLSESKNPQELMDAVNSMSRMLNALRSEYFVNNNHQRDAHYQSFVNDEDQEDNEMTKIVLYQGAQEPDETLNLQSNSAICRVPDDFAESDDGLPDKTTEEQGQILAICDSFCATENKNNTALSLSTSVDVYNQEMDQLIDFGSSASV